MWLSRAEDAAVAAAAAAVETKGFFTHQLVLVETLPFVVPGLVVIKLALKGERHHRNALRSAFKH